MAKDIKIKKGLDIPLEGKASAEITPDTATTLFGITPDDFPGHIWKARVKPGDTVKAGDTLLSDKATGNICLASPVAGTVEEVRRGERRKILAVTVRTERPPMTCTIGNEYFRHFDIHHSVEAIRETLQQSGLWAMIRQRPFDIVPEPDSIPRDIFITAFDSSPLAGDLLSPDDIPYLEKGIKILFMLTSGKVYLAVPEDSDIDSGMAEVLRMSGPHPAGNVGVQIAAVNPVNKGETVWTLNARTVCRIGRLFETGCSEWMEKVAVTGPEAVTPHYVTTLAGASLKTMLRGFLPADRSDLRVISGNVLTGVKADPENGFLRYPYTQITIMDEGAHADEFMGWASLNPKKYSVKRTFPAFLRGLGKPFPFDARIKGGHRAMIMSEEYDKVFPFDIYPEYLLKAIIAGNVDRMEKLGIYEVAPEDFALPEFVDTSKLELQKIVREGLDKLRNEE